MKKRQQIVYLILAIMLNLPLLAQENEVGAWGGTAVYLGDLNPTYSFKNARWATGVFYRYNFGKGRMSVKAGGNYAFLSADDSRIKGYPYLQARNLDFNSQIAELAITYEINFFKYSTYDYKDGTSKRWTPYLFTGVSMFYFNPITRYDGKRIQLESVGTEGQKSANIQTKNRGYNYYAFAMPYGGGFKIALTQHLALNVEISGRLTFNDYLDDVSKFYAEPTDVNYFINGENVGPDIADKSAGKIGVFGKQRGTSNDRDRFLFIGAGLTYTFITFKCPKVF
ncbi:MAG TPA: DUF6089 family protein [Chitinophagales bacterium]|nr:DUF6089 family protein [Chitinophagales bacterium]